jgi:hypothetical protein
MIKYIQHFLMTEIFHKSITIFHFNELNFPRLMNRKLKEMKYSTTSNLLSTNLYASVDFAIIGMSVRKLYDCDDIKVDRDGKVLGLISSFGPSNSLN